MTAEARNDSLSLITIYEISKILTSSLKLEKTLHEVLNLLASYLQMRLGTISLVDESGQLELIAALGMNAEQKKLGGARLASGVTGKILSGGMPIVVPNLAEEPAFTDHDLLTDLLDDEMVSFIGVPIRAGDKVVGVLSIDRVWDGRGSQVNFESDVRLLTMVANLIGQTVRLNQSVASERERLIIEKHRLEKAMQEPKKGAKVSLDNVIGSSGRMQSVYSEIHQIAPSKSTVLLRGESGTGKELFARAIHFLSQRKDGPFVKVNCAALTESLLESELFGHEKGAFTGALSERKGRFELAHNGTLFLDEIGEISATFQAKLLRVLQEGEFERVGGTKTIKVDVRLITATNRNLEEMVAKGDFRADLYYRINVVPINLPPLRERKEDIPLLVDHFLQQFNKENKRQVAISPEAMQVLLCCYFPGNVRELENCVHRMATMARGDVVRAIDLPCQKDQCLSSSLWKNRKSATVAPVRSSPDDSPASAPIPAAPAAAASEDDDEDFLLSEDFGGGSQRERLVKAMEKAGWVQAKAARLLGLTPRQVGYALKKYNIEVKRL